MTVQIQFENIANAYYEHHFRVDDESLVRAWQTSTDIADLESVIGTAWASVRESLGTYSGSTRRINAAALRNAGAPFYAEDAKGHYIFDPHEYEATRTETASLIQRAEKMRVNGVPLKELPKSDSKAAHYAWLTELAINPVAASDAATCEACGA